MARRAPLDEKPYRPLDTSILSAVLKPGLVAASTLDPARIDTPAAPAVVTLRSEPTGRPTALDHEKRILFTREEARALDRLVGNLAERLSAPSGNASAGFARHGDAPNSFPACGGGGERSEPEGVSPLAVCAASPPQSLRDSSPVNGGARVTTTHSRAWRTPTRSTASAPRRRTLRSCRRTRCAGPEAPSDRSP